MFHLEDEDGWSDKDDFSLLPVIVLFSIILFWLTFEMFCLTFNLFCFGLCCLLLRNVDILNWTNIDNDSFLLLRSRFFFIFFVCLCYDKLHFLGYEFLSNDEKIKNNLDFKKIRIRNYINCLRLNFILTPV